MELVKEIYFADDFNITLSNGMSCIGHSIDLCEAEDDDGNELGFLYLAFRNMDDGKIYYVKNEDIVGYEKLG